MTRVEFEPKLISVLKEKYSLKIFWHDLIAGVIVGIVALPLSIAFAIASGVKPEQGIYTAILAGFFVSVFSGSRVQIGGPTGAFIVIVFGIVQKYGYDGLALATLMAGILLILMGLARLGEVIKFIPYPVTVGFTSGIALIIFITQIRDFLGLAITLPDHFIDKVGMYLIHSPDLNLSALGIGILTIVILLYWPIITHRVPSPLLAIIVTTIIVHMFHLPVETIGTRFGSVPNSLPVPHLPPINLDLLIKMSSPALTIALLAGIESLLSAVVADGMTGRRHRSNMELVAQGIANIVSPLFSGIPATGAIARTATNIKSGGTTPIAGIVHAFTLLLIFLFFGHWAELIPMATLAGILIIVAYNMSEWHLFSRLLIRSPKSDVIVLLITFGLTVLVDLTVAIEVGMILAAFLFMRRMIAVTQVSHVTNSLTEEEDPNDPNAISGQKIPPGVEIFEINGPFFFGATDKFNDTLKEIKKIPKVLILGMRHVPAMDATGLRALEDVVEKSQKDGIKVILFGVNDQPLKVLNTAQLIDKIGKENIQKTLPQAINRAETLIK